MIRAPSRARLAIAAALLAAVALGTALRLAPARQPGSAFRADAAFHDRLIRAVVADGHLPDIDMLSEAPAGRRIAASLPVGLYLVAGGCLRALSALGARDVLAGELWFMALAGALIALPVYGAARALFRDAGAAVLAAAIAVFVPAHLHRTWCWWLRYDALGTLLAMTHLAFAFASLQATRVRAARLHAAASGLALIAALWVWRVPLMFPMLETGVVALVVALRPPERAVREWFTAIVAAGTLAAVAIPYEREQGMLYARAWLFAIALCAALHTPWLKRSDASWRTRLVVLLIVALVLVVPGLAGGRERSYGVLLRVLRYKLGSPWAPEAGPDPLAALSLHVQEMAGVAPGEWLGPSLFSWLGVWLLVAPLVLWWRAGWPSIARLSRAAPAGLLLAVLTIAVTIVTALFMRNKVLMAPLAAVVCGGSWWALRTRPGPAGEANPGRGARGRGKPARRAQPVPGAAWRTALALVLAACVVVTLRDGVWLAATRHARLEPGLSGALAMLRERTPGDARVLSVWNDGYEVQRYASRATLVDGMLESEVVRRRVVETAGALMQPTTDSLAAVCRRDGAGWLLVPPSTGLYGIAVITGAPFLHKLLPGIPLNREEANRVVVRMMVLGESLPPFEKVYERDGYRVYRLAGASPPP